MKKIVILVLAVVLFLCVLTACANGNAGDGNDNVPSALVTF